MRWRIPCTTPCIKAGYRPVRALQRLRAVTFSPEQAETLGVRPGDAGLLIERRGFLPDGRAAEFTQSYYYRRRRLTSL
jgi:GntR family transcriptional regulator